MKKANSKNWECPECGNINLWEMTLCVCGYLDDGFPTEYISASKQKSHSTKVEQKKNISPPKIKKGSVPRSNLFENWFNLASWKDSYARWMLILIITTFFLRGTTDGLWFLAYAAYAVAARLEAKKRHGTSFIIGKERGQSVWDFGVHQSIISIMSPRYFRIKSIEKEETQLLFINTFLCIFLLHLYVGFIILMDSFNPELVNDLLVKINSPFIDMLQYWRGLQYTVDKLVTHGYSDRVPMLNHVYIACALFSICVLIPSLFLWIKQHDSLEEFYNTRRNLLDNAHPIRANNIFSRLHGKLFRWYPSRLLLLALYCCFILWYLRDIIRLPLYFPDEPHLRHGKYIWMYSYAYRDNIGFFTPIYFIIPAVTGLLGIILHLFEPFARVGVFCKKCFPNDQNSKL